MVPPLWGVMMVRVRRSTAQAMNPPALQVCLVQLLLVEDIHVPHRKQHARPQELHCVQLQPSIFSSELPQFLHCRTPDLYSSATSCSASALFVIM
jgi:hypothetical protein